MRSRNALVLMTALPPTRGHQYLLDFALNFAKRAVPRIDFVEVLLCSRDCEPLDGNGRAEAVYEQFSASGLRVLHYHGDVPQAPAECHDFWSIWHNIIREKTMNKPGDIVFASEYYGSQLAEALQCEFIPCNIYREVIRTSGTAVRAFPIENFSMIMPSYQRRMRQTVTLFGAESTGKTTLAKTLEATLPGHFAPEWAREYLETVGAEITDEKMHAITLGQYATQMAVARQNDKPFIIQDTDLLSTIGYYRIYKGAVPDLVVDLFRLTKSDLYILTSSAIPFTPDNLRYGGDKRESDDGFWARILEEFDCRFVRLSPGSKKDQEFEAGRACREFFYTKFGALSTFVRDNAHLQAAT